MTGWSAMSPQSTRAIPIWRNSRMISRSPKPSNVSRILKCAAGAGGDSVPPFSGSVHENCVIFHAMAVADGKRTVAELKELRALTGDEDGAQRVAFTPLWATARQWLKGKMAELPVESHQDA